MIGLLNLLIANAMTMEEKRRLMCIGSSIKTLVNYERILIKALTKHGKP